MPEFYTLRKRTKHALIPEEVHAANLFPVLACDPDTNIFLCDDKNLAFSFHCEPLSGTAEKIEQQIVAALNESVPVNSCLTNNYFRSPDVQRVLARSIMMRDGFSHPLLTQMVKERASFLEKHSLEPMMFRAGDRMFNMGYIFDVQILYTLKVPIASNKPTAKELEDMQVLQTKLRTTLENVGHRPRPVDASAWLRFMQTLFNWGPGATWRSFGSQPDVRVPLCEQVVDYDNDIEIFKDKMRFGKKYVKCLSAKRFPRETYFGAALSLAGDLSGANGGVKSHYLITTNVVFGDADSERQNITLKHQYAVNQASGPIARFAPVLMDKKRDFDAIYESLQEGKRPVKISYHVVVFGDSEDDVESAAQSAKNFWQTQMFDILVDANIQMPIFVNCLPMCYDIKAAVDLWRLKPMTSKEAATLLPIFSEWKGTGTPHMLFQSRNGQLMTYSFHDTTSSPHGIVSALSGSGKSFAMNYAVCSYLSEGAQVWVIDIGRSFEKLAETFGDYADFVAFTADKAICLNPFPLIYSLDGTPETRAPDIDPSVDLSDDDGDEDTIVSLLEAMAAPTQPLSDFQKSALRKTLSVVWRQHFRKTTIDHIADALIENEDPRVKDVGHQLFSFTSKGAYGRYFVGENNVSFTKNFTVLELDELSGRAGLQAVVLLALIQRINAEVYLGDRSIRKMCLVDECWMHLSGGSGGGGVIAQFLESAFRKFRKANASIVIITQSVNDVYAGQTGRAIAENAAHTLLLGQKPETVESLKRSGNLQMSEYDFEQLKTVHSMPGAYSQIFMKSPLGNGISTLVVSDFEKLLYSTAPHDVHAINVKRKQGLGVAEAIRAVMADRNANHILKAS